MRKFMAGLIVAVLAVGAHALTLSELRDTMRNTTGATKRAGQAVARQYGIPEGTAIRFMAAFRANPDSDETKQYMRDVLETVNAAAPADKGARRRAAFFGAARRRADEDRAAAAAQAAAAARDARAARAAAAAGRAQQASILAQGYLVRAVAAQTAAEQVSARFPGAQAEARTAKQEAKTVRVSQGVIASAAAKSQEAALLAADPVKGLSSKYERNAINAADAAEAQRAIAEAACLAAEGAAQAAAAAEAAAGAPPPPPLFGDAQAIAMLGQLVNGLTINYVGKVIDNTSATGDGTAAIMVIGNAVGIAAFDKRFAVIAADKVSGKPTTLRRGDYIGFQKDRKNPSINQTVQFPDGHNEQLTTGNSRMVLQFEKLN
jgi:hypothetical protein